MPSLSKIGLDRALTLLAELITVHKRPSQAFVVCGGSSLLALNLVSRTTQDVDIIARLEGALLTPPSPLPEWLLTLADDVKERLDLPAGWLNAEAAMETLFSSGFPEGMRDRLTVRSYGPGLTIGFISRRDQIFLKLHAAVDRDGGRHLQDLLELKPSRAELNEASIWVQTQDSSEAFKFNLDALLRQLPHENS